MSPLSRGLIAAVLILPSLALAGTGSMLDVNLGSGVVGNWTGTTLGIATSFVPFLFVVALMVEAFGKAPGEPRDFGAVAWRTVVVVVLLAFYGAVFGNLAALLDGVSRSIAPQETWAKLSTATEAFLQSKADYQAKEMGAAAANRDVAGLAMQHLTGNVDALGGLLIDAVVALILLAGQAAFRIVGTFGQVLTMLLYVLGPLAIAASVPRGSDAGAKWLRIFVSVLLWPLVSALLVGLLSEYALKALAPQDSYEAAYKSIALAGILCVTAFAVPVVASGLTGAGMGAMGSGWSSMNAWTGAASAGGKAAASVAGVGGKHAGAMQAASMGAGAAAAAGGGGAGGGGGGLQSAGVVGGHGAGAARFAAPQRAAETREAPVLDGGGRAPQWAAKGVGSIVPAQASVSPAADAAAGRDVAAGGGVDFPRQAAAAPAQPPPFLWSGGGISPASSDDSVPTLKPVPLAGPAAAPVPRAAAHSPARKAGGFAPAQAASLARGRGPSAGEFPWATDDAGRKPEARPAVMPEHAKLGAAPVPVGDVRAVPDSNDEAKPTVRVPPAFPKR
jgi:hypothetical protein